jgi:hypothetical protein
MIAMTSTDTKHKSYTAKSSLSSLSSVKERKEDK